MPKKDEKVANNQQPITQLRDYFTEDISSQITRMSLQEMITTLRGLQQSEFWIAFLKYNQERLRIVQNSLFAGDPAKDPTGMARNQGIMLGLSDLQNAIIQLNAPSPEPEDGIDDQVQG